MTPSCWLVSSATVFATRVDDFIRLHRYRLCLSLLVLFLNRGPKSLSMWGVGSAFLPGG